MDIPSNIFHWQCAQSFVKLCTDWYQPIRIHISFISLKSRTHVSFLYSFITFGTIKRRADWEVLYFFPLLHTHTESKIERPIMYDYFSRIHKAFNFFIVNECSKYCSRWPGTCVASGKVKLVYSFLVLTELLINFFFLSSFNK